MSVDLGTPIGQILESSPLSKLSEDDKMIVAGQIAAAMQMLIQCAVAIPPEILSGQLKTLTCRHCQGAGYTFDPETTGAALRRMREQAGISLRRMAKLLEVSPAYLSEAETDHRKLSNNLVERYLSKVNSKHRNEG